MSRSDRYEVIETPDGWRVMERNANGFNIHQKKYKTRAEALARMQKLVAAYELATATTNVRKRANRRCECLGECERGHHARCGLRDGERNRVPGTRVALSVVALNHDTADVREENLRIYCQLCKQYHDADAAGADALFAIDEVES